MCEGICEYTHLCSHVCRGSCKSNRLHSPTCLPLTAILLAQLCKNANIAGVTHHALVLLSLQGEPGLVRMNYTGALGDSELLHILVILSLHCSDAGTNTHCEFDEELLEVLHAIIMSNSI